MGRRVRWQQRLAAEGRAEREEGRDECSAQGGTQRGAWPSLGRGDCHGFLLGFVLGDFLLN